MNEVFAIDVRPAAPSDEGVIFSTWLKSFRYASTPDIGKEMEDAIYFPFHRELILRCIERDTTRVAVATPPGDPGTVLGWVVVEPSHRLNQVIHYAYVKPAFRRLGITRRLLTHLGIDLTKKCWFTHRTKFIDTVAASARWPRLTHNPYLR